MTTAGRIEILLVEDDPGDAELMKEAVKRCNGRIDLVIVQDGEKALHYVRNEGGYSEVHRPDMIFLDLNLPKKSGLDVLRDIKAEKSLRVIPVFMLSSCSDDENVEKAYQCGANAYVVKPAGLEALCGLVRMVEDFWSLYARLPPPAAASAS